MFFVISLLRKRCFPECSSFASTRNICYANMTLNFFRNILFPQQMLLAGANDETIYVMFPQQCFFVYGGLYLNLYYPGYHKYDEQLLDALSHPITVHHHKNVIQYSHLTNSECTEYVTKRDSNPVASALALQCSTSLSYEDPYTGGRPIY